MEEMSPPIAHIHGIQCSRETYRDVGNASGDLELFWFWEDDGREEGDEFEEVLHAGFCGGEGGAVGGRDGVLDDELGDEVEGVEADAGEDYGGDEEVGGAC